MFVIAHVTKSNIPYYLYKVNPEGIAFILLSLKEALIFKNRQDAKSCLDSIKKDDVFNFEIFELSIKINK